MADQNLNIDIASQTPDSTVHNRGVISGGTVAELNISSLRSASGERAVNVSNLANSVEKDRDSIYGKLGEHQRVLDMLSNTPYPDNNGLPLFVTTFDSIERKVYQSNRAIAYTDHDMPNSSNVRIVDKAAGERGVIDSRLQLEKQHYWGEVLEVTKMRRDNETDEVLRGISKIANDGYMYLIGSDATNADGNRLYRIDPNTHDKLGTWILDNDQWNGNDSIEYIAGIDTDGDNLYICYTLGEASNRGTIHKFPIENLPASGSTLTRMSVSGISSAQFGASYYNPVSVTYDGDSDCLWVVTVSGTLAIVKISTDFSDVAAPTVILTGAGIDSNTRCVTYADNKLTYVDGSGSRIYTTIKPAVTGTVQIVSQINAVVYGTNIYGICITNDLLYMTVDNCIARVAWEKDTICLPQSAAQIPPNDWGKADPADGNSTPASHIYVINKIIDNATAHTDWVDDQFNGLKLFVRGGTYSGEWFTISDTDGTNGSVTISATSNKGTASATAMVAGQLIEVGIPEKNLLGRLSNAGDWQDGWSWGAGASIGWRDTQWISQGFILTKRSQIAEVRINVASETGTAVGSSEFRIETDVDGSPSGTLAHPDATFTADQSGMPGSGYYQVTFARPFMLDSYTQYHLVMQTAALDNNNLNFTYNTAAGAFKKGTFKASSDSGSTWGEVSAGAALYFEILSDNIPIAKVNNAVIDEEAGKIYMALGTYNVADGRGVAAYDIATGAVRMVEYSAGSSHCNLDVAFAGDYLIFLLSHPSSGNTLKVYDRWTYEFIKNIDSNPSLIRDTAIHAIDGKELVVDEETGRKEPFFIIGSYNKVHIYNPLSGEISNIDLTTMGSTRNVICYTCALADNGTALFGITDESIIDDSYCMGFRRIQDIKSAAPPSFASADFIIRGWHNEYMWGEGATYQNYFPFYTLERDPSSWTMGKNVGGRLYSDGDAGIWGNQQNPGRITFSGLNPEMVYSPQVGYQTVDGGATLHLRYAGSFTSSSWVNFTIPNSVNASYSPGPISGVTSFTLELYVDGWSGTPGNEGQRFHAITLYHKNANGFFGININQIAVRSKYDAGGNWIENEWAIATGEDDATRGTAVNIVLEQADKTTMLAASDNPFGYNGIGVGLDKTYAVNVDDSSSMFLEAYRTREDKQDGYNIKQMSASLYTSSIVETHSLLFREWSGATKGGKIAISDTMVCVCHNQGMTIYRMPYVDNDLVGAGEYRSVEHYDADGIARITGTMMGDFEKPLAALELSRGIGGHASLLPVRKDQLDYALLSDQAEIAPGVFLDYTNRIEGFKTPVQALDLGTGGQPDDTHLSHPSVIKVGSTYKMWYGGHDGSNWFNIMYADSSDGVTWANRQSVIAYNTEATYDSTYVNHPSVILDGATYKMWYNGNNGTGRIMYATSADGITWANHQMVLNVAGATLYGSHVDYPSVIKDGSTYKMWFGGSDGSNYRTFYATSADGIAWTVRNQPVADITDDPAWGSIHAFRPCVVKDGSVYKMFFGVAGTPFNAIEYKESNDGIHWGGFIRLFSPNLEGTWDATHALSPAAIIDNGVFKVWYTVHAGGSNRIVYTDNATVGTETFIPVVDVNGARVIDAPIQASGEYGGSVLFTPGGDKLSSLIAPAASIHGTSGSPSFTSLTWADPTAGVTSEHEVDPIADYSQMQLSLYKTKYGKSPLIKTFGDWRSEIPSF